MGDEASAEFGAADAFREPRVVVDPVGRAGLASEGATLDREGVRALASGVDRSREAAGPPPRMSTS